MIPLSMLNKCGIQRHFSTRNDTLHLLLELKNDPKKLDDLINSYANPINVFEDFFNYGTNIGEIFELMFEHKFSSHIIRKYTQKIKKDGTYCKTKTITQEYKNYALAKTLNKVSLIDRLVNYNNVHTCVEVKVIRASMEPLDEFEKLHNNFEIKLPSSLMDRSLLYAEKSKMNNVCFQQTRPLTFDFMFGYVIYLDKVELFVIPSNIIGQNNILPLTNQHSGAIDKYGRTDEGHVHLADVENLYNSNNSLIKKIEFYSIDSLLTFDDIHNYI